MAGFSKSSREAETIRRGERPIGAASSMRNAVATLALALLLPAIAIQVAYAADPDFVGSAALLDEPEVQQRLGLSDEQTEQVETLLKDRANAAVKAALEMRDLSDEQQLAKLAPVIAETEKQVRDLLDETQRTEFDRLRLQRQGTAALGEAEYADQFQLTDEQRGRVQELLAERDVKVAEAPADERDAVRASYETKLVEVLSPEQRQAWDEFVPAPGAVAATVADVPSSEAVPAPSDVAADPMPAPATPRAPAAIVDPNAGETGALANLDEVTLKLSFQGAPWGAVIEWIADTADLSLIMDAPPQGTLSYVDPKTYTLGQSLDLLNGILQTKGYRLLLKERMLILVNLDDPIPPLLIDTVKAEELDRRGSYELMRTLFQLRRMTVEQAADGIAKIIEPDGTYVALPASRQVMVTSTGNKLRFVRDFIAAAENPTGTGSGGVAVIPLKHRMAEEVMPTIRTLMGIPEDAYATADATLRISPDASGTRFLAVGAPASVETFREILTTLDVEDAALAADAAAIETPRLDVYAITAADPNMTLQVMQTLLAGLPDVRMAVDPASGNLIVLARPTQHATVKDTLDQLQKDARQVEVIRLRYVDASLAMQAINMLFGAPAAPLAAAAPGAPAPAAPAAPRNAPVVSADTLTSTLYIRGSAGQIAQIRELLQKMGELPEGEGEYLSDRGNIRLIPMTGNAARKAVGELESVWSSVRPNRIRVVSPSAVGAALRESGLEEDNGMIDQRRLAPLPPPAAGAGMAPAPLPGVPAPSATQAFPDEILQRMLELGFDPRELGRTPADEGPDSLPPRREPAPANPSGPSTPREPAAVPDASTTDPNELEDRSARSVRDSIDARYVSFLQDPTDAPAIDAAPPAQEAPADEATPTSPATDDLSPPSGDAPVASDEPAAEPTGPPKDIVVSATPNGLLIASEDQRALDEFEDLLNSINTASGTFGPQYTIFYLKHESATAAKQILEQALTGETDTADSGGGLLGDIAGQAMGDLGGGLLGGILGDSTSTAAGDFIIVANERLNALFVQASQTDLELMEDLLKIIDQEKSPEDVLTSGMARTIPLKNAQATVVAEQVKTIFADRMETSGQQQQGGQNRGGGGGGPSPEDLIRALSGGGRGGRGGPGGGAAAGAEAPKMTIGVDERSNSVIVRAPQPLFEEVKLLVEQLDVVQPGAEEAMQVMTLKHANSSMVQASLSSILGDNATITGSTETPTPSGGQSNNPGSSSGRSSGDSGSSRSNNDSSGDDIRRRIMERIQQGGFPGGGAPGGGRGGFPGGGFPGGGFPGGGPPGGGGGGRGGR